MRVYKVGGMVRDAVLGHKSHDHDYVVVGTTVDRMLELGYKPVGADFPVFLHPETGAEYALARTERKAGRGHKEFVIHADPDVSLEDDLARRDFTVNAMAQDEITGVIIDPYDGRRDISLRVLRHVTPAFTEDPLRVLRAARLAAELGFTIAPETLAMMTAIVHAGELEHLAVERIWQELARGLACERPVTMIKILRSCGACARLLPEVDDLFGIPQNPVTHPEGCAGTHTLMVLQVAAQNWWPLAVRWAALLHDIGKARTDPEQLPHHPGHEVIGAELAADVCTRLRVPGKVAQPALVAIREHGVVHAFEQLDAADVVDFFNRVAVWRNRNHLDCLLALADCDHAAHPSISDFVLHPQRALIEKLLTAVSAVSVAATAQKATDPGAAVHALRQDVVQAAMTT